MNIGLIGAGRMGSGVASRLMRAGHRVVVYNRTFAKTQELINQGMEGVKTVEELIAALPTPRVIWLYLPAGDVTQEHLAKLRSLLSAGDSLIDGGNSRFSDSLQEAAAAQAAGLGWLDVGTSGGIGGLEAGYCLMIGGDRELFNHLQPLWQAVAGPEGFALTGPAGTGHYTKMVHNAIEYGMLQAYAEGIALLEAGELGAQIDEQAVVAVWQRGSIITSRIGGWVAEALHTPDTLQGAKLVIEDNGESRWALEEAIERRVASPVLAAALFARFATQGLHPRSAQLTNTVRNLFGGHSLR